MSFSHSRHATMAGSPCAGDDTIQKESGMSDADTILSANHLLAFTARKPEAARGG